MHNAKRTTTKGVDFDAPFGLFDGLSWGGHRSSLSETVECLPRASCRQPVIVVPAKNGTGPQHRPSCMASGKALRPIVRRKAARPGARPNISHARPDVLGLSYSQCLAVGRGRRGGCVVLLPNVAPGVVASANMPPRAGEGGDGMVGKMARRVAITRSLDAPSHRHHDGEERPASPEQSLRRPRASSYATWLGRVQAGKQGCRPTGISLHATKFWAIVPSSTRHHLNVASYMYTSCSIVTLAGTDARYCSCKMLREHR